jgi:hypothetical protein
MDLRVRLSHQPKRETVMPQLRLRWLALLVVSLALAACDVIFDLEPIPTTIPTLAPPPPSDTPPPPSPSPQAFQGALTGRVWRDLCPAGSESTPLCKTSANGLFQGNGQFEDGETPLSGIAVNLGAGQCPSVGLAVVRTDAAGIYRFDNIGPGTYCVSINPADNPALANGGWTFPEVADKRGAAGQLAAASAGEVTGNVNFGWDDSLLPTPTNTPTPTITPTPTTTGTATRTGVPTRTRTLVPPTASATRTVTRTPTVTNTPTITSTPTATPTGSVTVTPTVTNTPTQTFTPTATPVRAVSISPPSAAQSGNPGTAVQYVFTVQNTGAAVDSFNVVASGQLTPTVSAATLTNLAPNASATVTVTVNIPLGTASGPTSQLLTVTSQGDSTKFASANMTTSVSLIANLTVSTPNSVQTVPSPGTAMYTVNLNNLGAFTDTVTVTSVSGNGWNVTLNPVSPITVAAGQTVTITVTIEVPAGQASGTLDSTTLTFRSGLNGNIAPQLVLTTTVQ